MWTGAKAATDVEPAVSVGTGSGAGAGAETDVEPAVSEVRCVR